jgi:hypothetical protein
MIDDAPTPPPSPELLARVARGGAVRTRRPLIALFGLCASAGAWATAWLLVRGWRVDLPFVRAGVLGGLGAAWAGAFGVAMWAAIMPRRGQVSPDAVRAGRVAALLAVGAVGLGALCRADAPGHTLAVGGAARLVALGHCLGFALLVSAAFGAAAWRVLRRVVVASPEGVGAAIGAGGAALAGFVLNLQCAVGGPLHLAVAHGGAVALSALLGALAGGRLLRG